MLLLKKANKRVYVGIDRSDEKLSDQDINTLFSGSIKKIVVIINQISIDDIMRIVRFRDMIKKISNTVELSVVMINNHLFIHRYIRSLATFFMCNGINMYLTNEYRIIGDNGYIYNIRRTDISPYALFIFIYDKHGFKMEDRTIYQRGFYFSSPKYKKDRKKIMKINPQFKKAVEYMENSELLSKYLTYPTQEFAVYQKMVAEELLENYL